MLVIAINKKKKYVSMTLSKGVGDRNQWEKMHQKELKQEKKTSQELRMLSSVTLNRQATKIVMNSGSQLSEL